MNNSADTFFIMSELGENKIETFLEVDTPRRLAAELDISFKDLIYNSNVLPSDKKYDVFEIKKRNGKARKICAPISGIKHIQTILSKILNQLYTAKFCVHGYTPYKSIKTNAKVHSRKRIVINFDLENFFPSINFGRVRGIFLSHPFCLNKDIATILSQICCYNGVLPQGGPTSPILSNFICRRLDNQLSALCKEYKMSYTRYADDITLSTNLKELPSNIGKIENNKLIVSDRLNEIITSNGFSLNKDKTRFAYRHHRQEVTGLIVNSGVNVNRKYVRHVRAMLHAWEKYNLENATKEHFAKYNYKNKKPKYPTLAFRNELAGKIGFIGQIKGINDSLYIKLCKRIKGLDSLIKLPIEETYTSLELPNIFCEGPSDKLHLETALKYFKSKGEFTNLDFYFVEYTDKHKDIGFSVLLKACESANTTKNNKTPIIYLFDRDVQEVNNKCKSNGKNYRYWGNNVYSVVLPIPPHRSFEEICIEHYYTDEELMTRDKKKRRLYLSTEFEPVTGWHKYEKVHHNKISYLRKPYPRIVDVATNENGENVALPKMHFAQNISGKKGNFKNISFENFKLAFDVFLEVLEDVEKRKAVY